MRLGDMINKLKHQKHPSNSVVELLLVVEELYRRQHQLRAELRDLIGKNDTEVLERLEEPAPITHSTPAKGSALEAKE